jgi:hypothetical protein
MLFREIIVVYCENHTKHTYILCEQNGEFWYAKAGGTYSNHWDLKGLTTILIHETSSYMCLNEWRINFVLINPPTVPSKYN